LILNLLVGLLIVRDFGVSYDEPEYYQYAKNTVDAYKSFFALAYTPVFGPHDLPNYGPAFIIFPQLGIRALTLIFPDLPVAEFWHFSYFVLFQLGGLCLYSLARRWFQPWTATGILLLYATQPLLWGHAFINPKDIPFMVFCLFTIWSGFRLADSLVTRHLDTALQSPRNFSLPRFRVQESLPYLRSPQLVLAGILLGMTMSIRLLGPLPGLVVILYLAFTLREEWLSVTIAYLIVATVTMFFTWPYLWSDPIDHWMDSLVLMVNFPWPGRVLFNGQFYDPDGLPFYYLPTLLNAQLTETLLILIYAGLVMLVYRVLSKRIRLDLLLVLVIGGLVPLVALILARATMYDNFRQLLFLLPPLILLAGFPLEWIFSTLKPVVLRLALLVALVAPGVYSMIQLHPYQYVYYNSLVGGTGGAFRKFELDYWCTSYREAALWLNQNAPPDARVGADEADHLLVLYLRDDLVAVNGPDERYDYFLATTRYNHDLTLYPDANVVYSIGRDTAVLAAVKQLSP
jgi:hypothetical protein